MTGYRTILAMVLALAVAVYQQQYGPLPVITPEVQALLLPLIGIALRFVTKTPVGHQ